MVFYHNNTSPNGEQDPSLSASLMAAGHFLGLTAGDLQLSLQLYTPAWSHLLRGISHALLQGLSIKQRFLGPGRASRKGLGTHI